MTAMQEAPLDLWEEILRHIFRYRVTTPEVLRRLFSEHQDEIESTLSALQEKELVSGPTPLYDDHQYYELTPRAIAQLFDASAPLQPITPPALQKAYGILAFCCMKGVPRQRFLALEFQASFPELCQTGLPASDYYGERLPSGKMVLGLLYVDRGQSEGDLQGSAYRAIGRCEELFRRRCKMEAFQELMAKREFRLTVLTATKKKARILGSQFSRRQLPFKPRIVVISEMARLELREKFT